MLSAFRRADHGGQARIAEALLLDAFQRDLLSFGRNFAAGEVVTATYDFLPGDLHQLHSFDFAGFKTNGGAGGNVEAFAIGRAAIKLQRCVRLDEVVVAANLDWAVAEIRDSNLRRGATDVEFDLSVFDFASTG